MVAIQSGGFLQFLLVHPRAEDDLDTREHLVRLDEAAELTAVDTGHDHIEQDQVGPAPGPGHQARGLLGAVGQSYLEALVPKLMLDEFRRLVAVVDHQDPGRPPGVARQGILLRILLLRHPSFSMREYSTPLFSPPRTATNTSNFIASISGCNETDYVSNSH
jgi:hypothetical protein